MTGREWLALYFIFFKRTQQTPSIYWKELGEPRNFSSQWCCVLIYCWLPYFLNTYGMYQQFMQLLIQAPARFKLKSFFNTFPCEALIVFFDVFTLLVTINYFILQVWFFFNELFLHAGSFHTVMLLPSSLYNSADAIRPELNQITGEWKLSSSLWV